MKQSIKSTWNAVINGPFKTGLIGYERQLQAYMFYELRNSLKDHIIWIEPMVYFTGNIILDGKKPDIVITKGKNIVSVMELKFNPWGYVRFQGDILKLKEFEKLTKTYDSIPLSWPPKFGKWNKQKETPGGEIKYGFAKNCLFVFAVVAHAESYALKDVNSGIKNFLHLTHFIDEKE